jgi:hypothetical protein
MMTDDVPLSLVDHWQPFHYGLGPVWNIGVAMSSAAFATRKAAGVSFDAALASTGP